MSSIKIVIFLIIIVIITLGFTLLSRSTNEVKFKEAIAAGFSEDTSSIKLNKLMPFRWDKVCYLPEDSIEKHTSIEKLKLLIEADLAKFPVEEIGYLSANNKNKSVFVFIEDGVIQFIIPITSTYVRINGVKYFWGAAYKKNCISFDDARLYIKKGAKAMHILVSD